jgi:LPXTG-motif cell wall-anchored protein
MPTVKRLRAPLVVMFAVIMASVAFAGPASAVPYANQPSTSVNNETPAAGSKVIFCGQGLPGTVTIVLDAGSHSIQYPSVTANPAGEFCTTIILPAGLTGTHTLSANASGRTSTTTIYIRGSNSGGVLAAGVSANSSIPATVAEASASAVTGGLAFTGTNAIGLGALGALLLVGGAALVLFGRRRKANA